jgi:hypothetical protein
MLFGRPRFERIMIPYSLSMIPGWHAVLERAGRRLVIERPYRGYVQYAVVEATG